MKPVLVVVLFFLMATVGSSSASPQAKDHSEDQSHSDTAQGVEYKIHQLLVDRQTDDDEAISTIFELDHNAVPVLITALQERKSMTRAARILAYIGGPEERKILLEAIKNEKDREKRLELSALLAGALVQPLSKEEWAFLENCVQRSKRKENRNSVVSFSAALALGTNGSQAALQLLEEGGPSSANTDDDSAKEIAIAIQWIKEKSLGKKAAISGAGSDSEQIAATVLANAFYAERDSTQPSVEKTVFTKDKTRALAVVQVYHGPKNAQGYDVVLQKSEGIWKIVGIWFTWAA